MIKEAMIMKSVRKQGMISYSAILLICAISFMGSCNQRSTTDGKSKEGLKISEPAIDPEGGRVEVGKTASLSVEVENPNGIELKYDWKAARGNLAPFSNLPRTVVKYTAPNMAGEDIVILKVSSNDKEVFTSKPLKITVVSKDTSEPGATSPPITRSGGPIITIIRVPPMGGGPGRRAEIAGRVDGVNNFKNYRVVIYSMVDYWYVQPFDYAPHTAINSDGTWSSFIHLGVQYVALLVEKSYMPPAQVADLPVEDRILARATSTPNR
jgi:hypothetical protein